jgi:hypothetical protein
MHLGLRIEEIKTGGEMRKKKSKDKTVCYAYVGRGDDGSLGWGMPTYLSDGYDFNIPYNNSLFKNELFEKCKITIETIPGFKRRRVK